MPLYYYYQKNNINGVAWSHDSKYIASASFDGTVLVRDVHTGKIIVTYSGHKDTAHGDIYVNDVAWSYGYNYIVSCSNGTKKQIHVWDAMTGKPYTILNGQTQSVNAVAWSPDTTYMASASYDGSVAAWAWDSNKQKVVTFRPSFTYLNTNLKGKMFDVAWSLDSTHIASSSTFPDQTVRILNGTDGMLENVCNGHTGDVLSVSWSTDNRIVSGSRDHTAIIWSVDGHLQFRYKQHTDAVRRVAWSSIPNSNLIASGCWNGELHVWDATTGKPVFKYQDNQKGINALAWSPDGTMIASGGFDNTVRIWTTLGLTG